MRGPAKGSTYKPVSMVSEDDFRRQLAERDEKILFLKEAQNEEKRKSRSKERKSPDKKNVRHIEQMMDVSDGNSNSTTPMSHALC